MCPENAKLGLDDEPRSDGSRGTTEADVAARAGLPASQIHLAAHGAPAARLAFSPVRAVRVPRTILEMTPPDPTDTSDDARRVQRAVWRTLPPVRRLEVAFEMSDAAREILAAGIRHRHPDWPPVRVRREVLVRCYGAELVEAAWGPRPVR